jgi:hypothetical protein
MVNVDHVRVARQTWLAYGSIVDPNVDHVSFGAGRPGVTQATAMRPGAASGSGSVASSSAFHSPIVWRSWK